MARMRDSLPRLLAASALLTGLAGGAAACGGGDDTPADPDAGYNCTIEMRDEAFAAGMEKVGDKGITFRLVSSDPTPPARGDNAWVLELEQTGAALDGADVSITTYMPDHGHNGSIDAVASPDPAVSGRYEIDNVNMWMPGLWEITVKATPAGGAAADTDQVVFRFCIPS